MSFSLAVFAPELTALYEQARDSGANSIGAWKKIYTLVFGLISVDENGDPLLSRGYDVNNDPVIVNRDGAVIDLNAAAIDIGNRYDGDFNPAAGVDPAAWVFLRGVPDVNAGLWGQAGHFGSIADVGSNDGDDELHGGVGNDILIAA